MPLKRKLGSHLWKAKNLPSPTSKESLKESAKQRLQQRVRQLRKQHRNVKQDTYVGGKYIVRASLHRSPLDKWIEAPPPKKPDPYPEGRMLSGWEHLNRFYAICRRPIKVHGVPFCRKENTFPFGRLRWLVIYAGSFFVVVEESGKGLRGNHPVTLWYRSCFKENFPIASTMWNDHFTKGGAEAVIEFIRDCILAKEFFQSETSEQQKIPM